LNYHIEPDLSASMFTVWVNEVEPTLSGKPAVFQTWNPLFEPAPERTISRTPLFRAVVHQGNQSTLDQLETLHAEADRRVFFCGSWASAGIPLLESAVQSAIRVAKHLNVTPTFAISDINI
jgi:predicted NAD/FAD-binding protein